ncbi:MAG TPA: cytochrome c [Methylomirabilota bacterium]|jgi:mono/diheme cytochrome c family protein|nr:cytochrome c [Methylomirabilota bacterium]
MRIVTVLALCVLGSFAPALAQPSSEETGRQVFFTQGCYGCHRLGVAGTPIAYDLSHVGRKYTQSQLASWLRDPASQKPTAHMPRLALSEAEIQALAAYLASLR